MKRLLLVLMLALLFTGCDRITDANEVCKGHEGVQRVNMTGHNINGVLCKDGYFRRDRF